VHRAATLREPLAPLAEDPRHTAVLLDIDGTLAPIVQHAAEANVPESTRHVLIGISRRFGLVACVSGRRASDARGIVGLGTISYLGNHGAELLLAGWTEPAIEPELAAWLPRIADFREQSDTTDLRALRVRIEDKEAIAAYHWRGAPDEAAAHAAAEQIAADAEAAGLEIHWGRKVLEVRPPVRFDKGSAIRRLLAGSYMSAALYIGDDRTDLEAFRSLRALVAEGALEHALCLAVGSAEEPSELIEEADEVLDGPASVRTLLSDLLAGAER
jgi:trehalose 6-phosphate phosphatase